MGEESNIFSNTRFAEWYHAPPRVRSPVSATSSCASRKWILNINPGFVFRYMPVQSFDWHFKSACSIDDAVGFGDGGL